MPSYNPKGIEPRWQRHWEENKVFRTPDQSDKPKFYILDMFPYPSSDGLHVGHPEGYTATDILARYRRMKGDNVLHPMGWDAFGLPAEEYARKTGKHPEVTTRENIDTFRRQIKSLGFSYDWGRELATTDPVYFKWTQWIFLQLYDTWYDPEQDKGRPIGQLPIPAEIKAKGEAAVRSYQDSYRLAYQAEAPVNWCPELGTVLANEEVQDGKSERGEHPVFRMPLRQWMLRITAYADRLLNDLTLVDWPEAIKKMQRDWIGRSEGAEVDFPVASAQSSIRVFTTRPDTLFGATYMVLAPEHPLVDAVTTAGQKAAVEAYRTEASRKSERERTEQAKKKTGVFTGGYAVNPVNQEVIPIWMADYVLISYGTGAIMGVPAHDERDFEFAKQFKLPIRVVVDPPAQWLQATKVFELIQEMARAIDQSFEVAGSESDRTGEPPTPPETTLSIQATQVTSRASRLWDRYGGDPLQITRAIYRNEPQLFDEVFTADGTGMNSGRFDDLATAEFKKRIIASLQERRLGQGKINYKLRDWLFSRQRYWGEPFPILHEVDGAGPLTGHVRTIPEDELPLELPKLEDYEPTGRPEPPLEKAADWVWVTRDGKRYKRETNTMPQWAGSCWYYLRFLDPHNDQALCDPGKERAWMPVDLYVGGAEHAVLHLLYARFWHKVLFDRGHVHSAEPFQKLVNQGMILGEMEFTGFKFGGKWVDAKDGEEEESNVERIKLTEDQVEKKVDRFVLKENPEIRIEARAYKMSKSRGNVINPDHVVGEYGADSMRLYEMFMGPLEATKPWSMRGVEGVYRFLSRVWRLIIDDRSEEMRLAGAVQNIEPDRTTLQKLHQTIRKVTEDLDGMRFNTAIAAMMELSNYLTGLKVRPRAVLETFVLLLSPFAPHLGEELWSALGHPKTLAYEPWPGFEEQLTREDEVEIPIQVNGKLRSKIRVPSGIDEESLKARVLADEKIRSLIAGKQILKWIIVPGKLVNIVVR